MRVTQAKAAENREKVVAVAARLFREQGFDGVGLDAIMAAAGLTHGGFYRQFGSKEALEAEALAQAFAASGAWGASKPSLRAYVDGYLSPPHRDAVGEGCAVAALAPDIARQGPGARARLTGYVTGQIVRLMGWMTGRSEAERRQRALATLSGMVGALVLARAVDDPALSDEFLAAGRAVLGEGFSGGPDVAGVADEARG